MDEFPHQPVFPDEVLRLLAPHPGGYYVDATADGGGHAIAIIRVIRPLDAARGKPGKLLAIEWDEELFEKLKVRLKKECTRSSKNYVLRRMSYTELARLVRSLRFGPVRGVLFDLGMSSFHLEASRRGFSFQRDEPLDMRYSRGQTETAADVLARRTPRELEEIFRNFGDERYARPIAAAIVRERSHRPIRRTGDLVRVIRSAVPARAIRSRIHFATRVFQALRIAVNREFENIERGLAAAAEVLAPGGRIVAISFHYREDALVKHFFRQPAMREAFTPLVERPLTPSRAEVARNPRSRSALLRAYEKVS
ncbi:MAG: 16S rRNA (cytosine(1402)-N(4))-methyltransferase RsmH [bacterium]|nr:16S rRNA (cytosine(1402)-N(4))-methyltransferase RsmH [bacterium]